MKFPSQCPVFMVVDAFGKYLRTGAIVEGVSPNIKGRDFSGVGARVLDDSELVAKPKERHPVDGWYGIVFDHSVLRPLTSSARAMLDVAKEQADGDGK